MYRPLPDGLTIKNSPIEGLGLFTNVDIKKNTFIGVTHIRDEQFENKYIRTPLGGFYNHSDDPTTKKFPGNDNDGENVFFNLQEKPDAKYFFMVAAKDIKAGNELTANYNLYTYPKTGVGLQMI